ERLREFNAMYGKESKDEKPFKGIVFRGRGSPDYMAPEKPDGGFYTLCRRPDAAKALGDAEMSPGSSICKGCFHIGHPDPVKACSYVPQGREGADVIFTAFNYAFLKGTLKNFGGVEPYAVVFDEDAVKAALEGFSGEDGRGERAIGLQHVNREIP